MITPEYISTKVPSTRACPNCLTLIEHERACKHVKSQEYISTHKQKHKNIFKFR